MVTIVESVYAGEESAEVEDAAGLFFFFQQGEEVWYGSQCSIVDGVLVAEHPIKKVIGLFVLSSYQLIDQAGDIICGAICMVKVLPIGIR